MKKIITTAAYPFIPAELNMAHMASTYIPADVYHRFMKLLGYNSVFVSATDVHGVAVKNILKNNDMDLEEIICTFHEKYKKLFSCLNVKFDTYSRTDTRDVEELVRQSLIKIKEKGYIIKKESSNYYCKQCSEYLPKRFRIKTQEFTQTNKMKLSGNQEDMCCFFCGNTEIAEQKIDHWFLDIPKGKEIISEIVTKQTNKNVKTYLESVINLGLKEWDFTREDYIGIRIPFEEKEQYIYLWYESLIAYMTLFDREEDVELRHFMGKNIIYYHGIIWPLLLREGLNIKNMDMHICAKGFMNITKSDSVLIDIEKAVQKFDKDYLRFYIIYRTQDTIDDFSFTENHFKQIINKVLCRQLGGFLNRCRSILMKNKVENVPKWNKEDELLTDSKPLLEVAILNMNVNNALMLVIEYIKKCGKYIQLHTIYKSPSKEQLGLLCHMMASVIILLKPFIPDVINNYNIFNNIELKSLDQLEFLEGEKVIYNNLIWEMLDE
ncbi:MAG: hypothetical protein CVU84_14660 [Firmicutes bacterium HGW-Firmicutes-1]|jgi:methionyl-tRNA synthetase|nr:MAG: hypothetical protein CVU84_14660 [Firmicutes bacterium HGW-Firmicutes-1]